MVFQYINSGKAVRLEDLIRSGDIKLNTIINIYDKEGKLLCSDVWVDTRKGIYHDSIGKAYKSGSGRTVLFRLVEETENRENVPGNLVEHMIRTAQEVYETRDHLKAADMINTGNWAIVAASVKDLNVTWLLVKHDGMSSCSMDVTPEARERLSRELHERIAEETDEKLKKRANQCRSTSTSTPANRSGCET